MRVFVLARMLAGIAVFLTLLLLRRHLAPTGTPTGTPPLISMLCSTTGRRARFFHNVLGSFRRSTHPQRELLVYDDEPGAPSSFWVVAAAADPNIRYFHRPERDGAPVGIGLKHARMMQWARGVYMAVIDDDDYYSARYLSTMLAELRRTGAEAVKLGRWTQAVGRWNGAGTRLALEFWAADLLGGSGRSIRNGSSKDASKLPMQQVLGFGFTYFFSRRVAEASRPGTAVAQRAWARREMMYNWDANWLWAVHEVAGLKVQVLRKHDRWLVVKVQHGDNISGALQGTLSRLSASASEVHEALASLRASGLPVTSFPEASCQLTPHSDIRTTEFGALELQLRRRDGTPDRVVASSAQVCCNMCAWHPSGACRSFVLIQPPGSPDSAGGNTGAPPPVCTFRRAAPAHDRNNRLHTCAYCTHGELELGQLAAVAADV